LEGEIRKINPSSFDGESRGEDDVEAWLLGIRTYFILHNYSSNLKSKFFAYFLHGKDALRWNYVNNLSTLMRVT
jgi:hypothetical protein